MVKSNLAAWTPAEHNPPYLSINLNESKGTIEICMRSKMKEDGSLGNDAKVEMTIGEFSEILKELLINIRTLED